MPLVEAQAAAMQTAYIHRQKLMPYKLQTLLKQK
jgi:hypothetical protein